MTMSGLVEKFSDTNEKFALEVKGKSKMDVLDANEYLVVVGNFGLYQWLMTLQLGLLVMFQGQQMFATVFTQFLPTYTCADTINGTSVLNISGVQVAQDQCKYFVSTGVPNTTIEHKCSSFNFDQSVFVRSVPTQFELVCDHKFLSTILTMSYMASVGVGAIFGSYLSDRFGRKPMVIANSAIIGIFGSITSASVSVVMYIVMRCLVGLFSFSGFTAAMVLASECTAPIKRSQAMNILELFWVLGSCSLSFLAYFLRDWWQIQLTISLLPLIVTFMYIWTLDESPHWYFTNHKPQLGLKVLQKMCTKNKVVTDLSFLMPEDYQDGADLRVQPTKHEGCFKICSKWRLMIRFVIFCIGWMACSLTYYALSFGVAGLAGDIFLNNFLMCIVEGLAYAACFSIAVLGRRWPTVISFEMGGLALLVNVFLILYFKNSVIAVTVMSMVGKFMISAAWQIIIVWEVEIYPTTHRCTLGSLNGLFGRVGGIAAPFLVDLHRYIDIPNEEILMPCLFASIICVTGFLHIFIPETNKCKLPENLEEANVARFPLADELQGGIHRRHLIQAREENM